MTDSGRPDVPHPPYEELEAAAHGDPEAQRHVQALRAQMQSSRPDPDAVREHATRLRGIGDLEARIANWWDDPATQNWVKALTDAGL